MEKCLCIDARTPRSEHLTPVAQQDVISFPVALRAAGHAYSFQLLPAKAKQDPTIKVQCLTFLFLLLS